MRNIIWSIRSMFCDHEWDREEKWNEKYYPEYRFTEKTLWVSATCNKCGWHRRYRKF